MSLPVMKSCVAAINGSPLRGVIIFDFTYDIKTIFKKSRKVELSLNEYQTRK